MHDSEESQPNPHARRFRSASLDDGGALAGEVASALVHLHREHFGRGPANARAYIGDDILVCVLSDVYTQVERTLLDLGKTDLVRETRLIYQRAVETQYVEIVERVTGRRVTAFASTVTFNPDQAIELFNLAAPHTRPPTPSQ